MSNDFEPLRERRPWRLRSRNMFTMRMNDFYKEACAWEQFDAYRIVEQPVARTMAAVIESLRDRLENV